MKNLVLYHGGEHDASLTSAGSLLFEGTNVIGLDADATKFQLLDANEVVVTAKRVFIDSQSVVSLFPNAKIVSDQPIAINYEENADLADYIIVPEDYVLSEEQVGGKYVYTVQPAPEAMIGETVYDTLEEAIQAAQAGDTITLLSSVEMESVILTEVDFDLNGHRATIGTFLSFGGRVYDSTEDRAGELRTMDDYHFIMSNTENLVEG